MAAPTQAAEVAAGRRGCRRQAAAVVAAVATDADDAACVGRHLATRNNMRVSGSRQLRVVVLVSLEAGLVIGRDSDKMMDERVLKEGFS